MDKSKFVAASPEQPPPPPYSDIGHENQMFGPAAPLQPGVGQQQPPSGPAPGYQPGGQGQVIAQGGQPQAFPPGQTHYTFYQPAPGQAGQYGQNVVFQQPTGYVMVNPGPLPKDQLLYAVLVTFFCFWPTGIIAVMKAVEARNAHARGDSMTAQQNTQSARKMVRISVLVGILCYMLLVVLIGLYIGIILQVGLPTFDEDDDHN